MTVILQASAVLCVGIVAWLTYIILREDKNR
jgi:hypothetical protein